MRLLGLHAAAGVTLLTLATMAPAGAQTPDPAPTGTTTTSRSDCTPGGRLVVKQTRLESGTTRVVIAGHDVPNGRWKGSFAPDASTTDGDVPIDVTAKRHEFRTEIEVEGVTGDTNTTLLRGSVARACAVGQTARPRTTAVSSLAMGLVARQQTSGDLMVRGAVVGCENGSSWRFALDVEIVGGGFGGGGNKVICRQHQVRIPPLSSTDTDNPPTAMSLVARSDGDVRRISFRSTVR